MKIDESLNLVLNVGNGYALYHTPISRGVFEVNFKLLAATKSELAGKGIHYQMDSGPRIASLLLMDEAKKDDNEEAGKALLAEIKRLSMVLAPGENGWSMSPVDAAINADKIDIDDWREVESSLVFFTCHFSMAAKREKKTMASAVASLLKGFTTSLACSEYADSLLISTTGENIPMVASSVPR